MTTMKDELAANMAALSDFSLTNPESGRLIWDRMYQLAAESGESADTLARIELAREYHCNPSFRSAMTDYVFEVTYRA